MQFWTSTLFTNSFPWKREREYKHRVAALRISTSYAINLVSLNKQRSGNGKEVSISVTWKTFWVSKGQHVSAIKPIWIVYNVHKQKGGSTAVPIVKLGVFILYFLQLFEGEKVHLSIRPPAGTIKELFLSNFLIKCLHFLLHDKRSLLIPGKSKDQRPRFFSLLVNYSTVCLVVNRGSLWNCVITISMSIHFPVINTACFKVRQRR